MLGSCKILTWNFSGYMTNLGISSQSHVNLNLGRTMECDCGMDDLSSTMKGMGTDTDSGIKLKSSLDLRVGVGSWV